MKKLKEGPVYEYEGNLYINMTNDCTNACKFCDKEHLSRMVGHNLILKKEPSVEQIVKELLMKNNCSDLPKDAEIVFCGAGEPTTRMKDMVTIAAMYAEKAFHKRPLRLDTNGHLFLLYEAQKSGMDIKLNDPAKTLVDEIYNVGITSVNISLNVLVPGEGKAAFDFLGTARKYAEVCRPNADALKTNPFLVFDYVLSFMMQCVNKKVDKKDNKKVDKKVDKKEMDVGVSFIDNYTRKEDAEMFLKKIGLEGRVRLIMRHADNLPDIKPEA